MSLGGGGGGTPKLGKKEKPKKAPKSPNRKDKNVRKPAEKVAAQAARQGSTVTNLLSARADGVVGAPPPPTSYTTGVFGSR